jgi:hypothetical protein
MNKMGNPNETEITNPEEPVVATKTSSKKKSSK